MKESDIQKAILGWLAAKHILAFRLNVGAMKIEKRFVEFGVPGMADILCFPHDFYGEPRPMWLEVKNERGVQSEFQKSFQKQVEEDGHGYLICRSVDSVEEYMKRCFGI